ncbi:protein bunched, class 2/F/G isoform-like isoform X4 [Cydia splendana]|uniref:protein bunched, class 2/F/G isoform-like isoform X4 n=1 Tax=Cydia splendana TaxID=1100963 RepID=UPI00300D2978
MADNLIQKSHKSSEKNKYNNVVHRTTSESLRLNESEKGVTHPTSLQAAHNPRKISSFQITSVTVGSRVSTDAGEDSADDLDESHTDDISRVTDIENETPSYSEDTFSKDDVFYNASSTSLGCAPVIPTSTQYGLAIVGQEPAPNQGSVPNSNSSEVNDMHVSVTNAGSGSIINLIGNAKPQEGMKEIQEHVRNERFKVVKIESTEPFRRGRWMCMDYLDHTTQQNPPITLNNNLDTTETTLQAPDSGVVINDSQHDDMCNDLTNRGLKDMQGNAPIVQQLDQNVQKQFPMASPGQSLTQPINVVQQQHPVAQSVSVQSPPLEKPQQLTNQTMQNNQQVAQQHPQSMTHITMQNPAQGHPQPTQQQQQVQQIPQSFPQHQLQQVISQSQGIPMQQIPMHQQMPQQMQQIPNQQMQQMNQHIPQTQIPNMQQMQQQIPQMQGMPNQAQIAQAQQPQMQQMQQMQMQGQPNPQQLHPMQQAQMPNMAQTHHLQGQQPMGGQQPQLQHMPSQAQIQALQNQQIPNHIQQMQMPTQLAGTNQQMPQMQTQMHQLPSQPQQVQMHPQLQQQGMSGVQPQYNQAVSQQPVSQQAMMNTTMPSSQPQMVQPQHNVPQYHTQPSQMSQQGQTLPQEVLTSIATSQQGATLPSNLQPMANQPQGSTLPANLQSLASQQQQNPVHIAPQQGNVPQGNMQMMGQAPQNMQMTLDGNQPSMQIPASDPMYMQPGTVAPTMPQHITQQGMLPQQPAQLGVQYVPGQAVPQVSLAHQNIPMSMQQTMPVMGAPVHPNVVQSQTSMGLTYGGVVPVMSQSSVAPVESTVSGTNSPVVSLPVSSTAYPANHDSSSFGSPVSGVVSHAISGSVMSSVNVPCDSAEVPTEAAAGDTGDGKEEPTATANEDESASGTSAVAIDNKIEQAMDLVKSHLMFAVREEVEVLKERIAELMERINQLEVENTYLRAHASQDTLAALPAAGAKPPPAPQGPQPPVS